MSTGQIVGTITGAAVGFFVGGPSGAVYGAQIGYTAGTALDPPKGPTVEGPRLSDLSVQTSTYGQFIPRTYGTIGLSGNVFWLENNKIKEVVKKKKSGGKGGGSSSTVKTYTYYATFAVGLCEGPIAGVRRIWVGPDLVYDAGSDDLETIISSNQASAKFTIYLGTDTQQPDSRMQAEMGVANCPAYRGLAYIVVKDLKLTNYGNSVAGAQVKVEVVTQLEAESVNLEYSLLPGYSSGYACALNPMSADGYKSAAWLTAGPVDVSINPVTLVRKPDGYIYKSLSDHIGFAPSGGFIPMVCKLSASDCVMTINRQFAGNGWCGIWRDDIFASITLPYAHVAKGLIESGERSYLLIGQYQIEAIYQIVEFGFVPVMDSLPVAPGPAWGNATFVITDDGFVMIYKSLSSPTIEIARYNDSGYSYSSIVFAGPAITSRTPTDIADGIVSMALSYTSTTCRILRFDIDSGTIVSDRNEPFASPGTTESYESMRYVNDLIFMSGVSVGGLFESVVQVEKEASETISLADIVSAEAILSILIKPSDINTSGLTDSVTGFKVTATGSIRNAIEPLRGAWPFDVVQSGYKIKATSRGSASVVTIPVGELAIDTQLTESREMDSQLPQNVTVKYIDRDRDYDQNEQRAQRDNTEAVNSLVLELPVVLSATQSAQVADKLIRIYALEKSDFSFTLPAPYRYLEPGDVVTIAATDADYVLRLVSANQTADGRLECAGRPSSAATYTSIAPGDGGQQGSVTIPLTGATVGLIVDCPVIDEGLQDAPGFAVGMNGYSAGWPGGILYRTADGGQTWDDLQALEGRATAGFAAGVLAASAGNLIQRGGSLTVSLIGGTLESVTEAQMLNGANIAAYGVNGRWEILRFQNATLNGNGTYTLDTFWRGDKGTEWATGLHAANDIFVLMTDPDLAFVGMPTDSIGQPRDYRSVTAGASIDSAASQAFTYSAVNLETLSGVHPLGSRSSGDLTITWQRRTRVGGAWRDYVDASLGEVSQAYEVDIMSGATVKRTLSASTPSVLYTSAMQVTDFGSPQASVTVNIYQLSAVVGRGYKLEATL